MPKIFSLFATNKDKNMKINNQQSFSSIAGLETKIKMERVEDIE